MKRQKFSREYKLEAVKQVRERGVSSAQVARDLGVGANVVSRWVREASGDIRKAFPGQGQQSAEQAEIERLKREIVKLKAEKDILKKSRGLLRERVELRFSFMAKHRGIWPMRWMCEALDVSRGGYYAWLKRPPSAHERRDEELRGAIRRSFDDSDRTYRARRVRRDLGAWGQLCGIHRVERLMLAAGLQARRKRRRLPFDTGLRAITAIAPNLLDQEFQADAPNQRWVADFTYIWTDEGWLYAAAVLDLFWRMVVGWSMQNQMTARLVSDAMLMAIWRRRPSAELLHHSDQGSQYTSEQFQALLAQHGVVCSVSRSGDCWDNAAMESFFSTLKTERCSRKIYRTRDEARADVFDYIERFYNPRRRHSTLDYLSPLEFEQQRRSG
jgi:putative transposase